MPVVTARPGLEYAIGRMRVRVLWPDGPGVASEDPNLLATVCWSRMARPTSCSAPMRSLPCC